jgi:secreted PhoX family phosphatase
VPKNFDEMENSNSSDNLSIHELVDTRRRQILQGGMATLAATLAPLAATSSLVSQSVAAATLGFKAVPPGQGDRLVVPEGYRATVIAPWGEPVGVAGKMPPFRWDGSNTADDQAVQMGMHHDGMHFYPLGTNSDHGLLAMNHEYADEGLLHPGGMNDWSAEKVRKSLAAHGLSVIEIKSTGGQWAMVRPSRFARRITMHSPFTIAGPAAGHPLLRTNADPSGTVVLGTLGNCASGMTPWGTYLSGEENWAYYFDAAEKPDSHQLRWGLKSPRSGYRWGEFEERFKVDKNPNEPNRFGWIVELDPMDPTSTPIKRTALGRAAHEGAWVAVTRSGRAVVYSGEDARFEYIYKFVSRDPIKPAGNGLSAAQANRELLDHGTLYVAKFGADGRGEWVALRYGEGPLTPANGFHDQGEVLIKARQASDALGATKMDRPEWLAIDPKSGWVYCTLTNNSARGTGVNPGVDPANPRANNVMGQIIRWHDDGDFDGTGFSWNHLVLAGDPANERPEAQGNIKGDPFACPDGIAFDPRGTLWIQTDVSSSEMHRGELKRMGNNQMLACDVQSGETRRFLTGPTNCEVTGLAWTPDGRTMFLNIQHPGETANDRNDPANPTKFSNWPDYRPDGRPRSATVVVQHEDGRVIGT